MANTMRWRYGDTNPVLAAVDASTVIEIGDLLYLDTDDAKPASDLVDHGTEILNQEAIHDNFLGVAMQCSSDGETGSIRVATNGVFEFDCDASTFDLGDLLGASEDAGGTKLRSQSVESVLAVTASIGRCAKRVASASSRVLVDIVSTTMKGGIQDVVT